MGPVEVRPLDAPLGAVVCGVDFERPLAEDARRHVLAALSRHLLLVFRGHDRVPAPRAFRDFGLRFGPLRPSVADLSRLHEHPEVNLVSNTVEPDGVTGTGGTGVVDWHADMNFEAPATDYIVLDAVELPSAGGNTRLANLHAAYAALPAGMRERIDPLQVRYKFRQDLEYAKLSAKQRASLPGITHSLVQSRFPALRRGLWPNVGIFDGTVLGLDLSEGEELLASLLAHATQERFVYEHEWELGDCAMWSNWSVFHRREPFDPSQRRVMRHLTISEGGPVIDASGREP